MNIPQKTLSLLAIASFYTFSSLFAVETDPVGYVTYTVKGGADNKFSIPLQQSPVYSGSVSGVTAGQIDVTGVVPDLSTSTHLLIVTTDGGSLEGHYYEVASDTSTSITVLDDPESDGLSSSDTVKVIPAWTLDTLFPSGGDIPASSDVFNPVGTILTNSDSVTGINMSSAATYLYHSGQQGPAGWYDADNLGAGPVGGTVLSPDTYITVRNGSASDASVVVAGSVPTDTLAIDILSSTIAVDNQIVNPFPAGLTLDSSNLYVGVGGPLAGSTDVFNPTEQIFIYEGVPTGQNPGTSKSVIYHTGEQGPAGYYDPDDLAAGPIGSYEIPAGAAFIIRKAAGSASTVSWTPTLPYTL